MLYRFDEFELDLLRYELRRRGKVVQIEPKALDLLFYLIRYRARLVSKDEILDALWDGRVVGETSLTRCVSLARKVLGDSASEPRWIRTQRARGYQFIGAVIEAGFQSKERSAAPVPPGSEPTPASEASAALPASPFVGREREMAQLRGAFERLIRGRGQLVFLMGEPGIGKSRTAEELATEARARGIRVRIGRASEAEAAPAFWPWVQIVRAECEFLGPVAARAVLGAGASDIAQVVPELHELLAEVAPTSSVDAPEARFRLFDSLTRFFRRLASEQPLLLILDDLHRADLPSALLLRFLASELDDMSLLVLATYRDAELRRDRKLAEVVADAMRQAAAPSIPLRGLSRNAVADLLHELNGTPASESVVSRLHELSGGNPFFLMQVVTLLRSEERMDDSEGAMAAGPLPHVVRDAIRYQLRGLTRECHALLEVAAVIGREFDVVILEAASGVKGHEFLERLGEALHAGVLLETLPSGRRCRFAHVLLRDAIYEELTALERARLHERVGLAIEAMHAGDLAPHLAALAHHFLEASALGHGARAFDYSARAGEWANQRLAYEEAIWHWRQALEALDFTLEDAGARRVQLLLSLGEAQARAGDRENARETCQRAIDLARRREEPERLARAVLAMSPGLFAIEAGVFDAPLVALLEEALRVLGDRNGCLRARLMGRLAIALYSSGDQERRARLSEEALEIAQRIGDPGTLAYAMSARHSALWGPENLEERLHVAQEIVDLAARAGDQEMSLLYRVFRITNLLEQGAIPDLDREIATFTRIAKELRQPQSLWYTVMYQSMRLLVQGQFEEAERLAHEFHAMGQRIQDVNVPLSFATHFAMARMERGQLEPMLPLLESVTRSHPYMVAWHGGLGWVYAQLDRRAETAREFEVLAADQFSQIPRDMNWLSAVYLAAELCSYLGDRERSAVLYELLLPYAERYVVVGYGVVCLGSAARALGLLAAVLGERGAAARHFEQALERNSRIGGVSFVARTQLDYARLLTKHGGSCDRAQANALAAAALHTARSLGMKALEKQLSLIV